MATTLGRASAAMSETSMPERVPEREVLATVVFHLGLHITLHKTHRINHIFGAGLFSLLLPNPLELGYIPPG